MPRMDAVLPLTARDVERSDLLLRSLERHVTGISTLLVIMPPADISRFRPPATERFAHACKLASTSCALHGMAELDAALRDTDIARERATAATPI